MKKIDIVKEYLVKENVKKALLHEIDLLLDSNYGEEIQLIYSLVETPKEDLGDYFKVITKEQCLKLKWQFINSTLDAVQRFIAWDEDIKVSNSTIKKGMKEINFYNDFNNYFIDNLNGDSDNIAIFKRWFIGKNK